MSCDRAALGVASSDLVKATQIICSASTNSILTALRRRRRAFLGVNRGAVILAQSEKCPPCHEHTHDDRELDCELAWTA
jgi:hypothetical protein